MNITQLKKYCSEYLAPYFDNVALSFIVKRFIEGVYAVTNRDFILTPLKEVAVDSAKLISLLQRLATGEPIQYVLGFECFRNHNFWVKEGVLIPRPETEQLVEMIVDNNCELKSVPNGGAILDIGTGSGAIAISLALEFGNCRVQGWDVSPIALEVAGVNRERLGVANLSIVACDILSFDAQLYAQSSAEKFDIIVSNPPYVTCSEKSCMERNVLDYEPELALFVDDNDPLIFYRTIATAAQWLLKEGGKLYFEINEQFGEQTAELLIQRGFKSVEIVSDFRDRVRFVIGEYR